MPSDSLEPGASSNNRLERSRAAASTRWLLISFAGVIVLALPSWVAWEIWRAHAVNAFCKDVKVGMPFADLLRTERRHWINKSYLVQAMFEDYVDQAHSHDLEFRSHMLDPPFACAISHDGHTVTSVHLLGE
jgi:hypothetical protein